MTSQTSSGKGHSASPISSASVRTSKTRASPAAFVQGASASSGSRALQRLRNNSRRGHTAPRFRPTAEEQTLLGADASVLRATRLLRLFTEQLEALAKLRGKTSQQKVIVEHVTVGAGAQAIVGVVPG